MNYLIKLSYDGSKFFGFQRLNEELSVQKVLEDALSTINKCPVEIKGAGRTDRGVHAYNQAVSFSLDVDIPCERLINAINSLVGNYIYINSCEEVDDSFHARFSAIEKIYEYRIWLGEMDPLKYDYYEFIKNLDTRKMSEASKLFLGGHLFNNFVSGERDNYEMIINSIEFNQDGEELRIVFRGKSFYRYMVRNIVGSLIQVGLGRIYIDEVRRAINEPNIEAQIYTASAKGLYLIDVLYK